MRAIIIMALTLAGMSNSSSAQSLDIGGVEIRIGQDVNDALKSLSFYNVNYNGSGWFVTHKTGSNYSFLGTFAAQNNKVSHISKQFDTDNANVSVLYASANNELHRRGGQTCSIYEKVVQESSVAGYLHGFEKKCGWYKLVYYMPSKMKDGQSISSSIGLYVGASDPQR